MTSASAPAVWAVRAFLLKPHVGAGGAALPLRIRAIFPSSEPGGGALTQPSPTVAGVPVATISPSPASGTVASEPAARLYVTIRVPIRNAGRVAFLLTKDAPP